MRWTSLGLPSLVAASIGALIALSGCTPSSTETIQNRGSDTMIELAQAWAEKYPDASVEVSGGGSGVGITALIDGNVDIANASREMRDEEIEKAKASGKEPKKHVVGYDALAIYIHKDNPLEEISLEQLKQIFGEGGTITKWSQLGVTVPGCSEDTISVIGRQNNSGTYEYLREAVLGSRGKYRLDISAASGSKDLVKRVSITPCAIGYSGMGYKTDDVKFLKVHKGDGEAVLPSVQAVHDNAYPISRPLFMYTIGTPSGPTQKYIDWVRSDAGQAYLEDIGYVPLPIAARTKLPAKGSAEKAGGETGAAPEPGPAEKGGTEGGTAGSPSKE